MGSTVQRAVCTEDGRFFGFSPGSALESEPSAWLCRVGDTYPNQHLETVVRVHFYRWRPKRKCGESGYPTVKS